MRTFQPEPQPEATPEPRRAAPDRVDLALRALVMRGGVSNAMVARWVDGDPADDKLADDVGSLGDLDDAARVARIEQELGGDARLIEILWGGFSDVEAAARANPDLFTRSLERAGGIANLPPFKAIREQFATDVEAVALGHLAANRTYVVGEMEKVGVGAEQPDAEQQHQLHDVQKMAELITRCDEAMGRFTTVPVGYDWDVTDGPGGSSRSEKSPVNFDPGPQADGRGRGHEVLGRGQRRVPAGGRAEGRDRGQVAGGAGDDRDARGAPRRSRARTSRPRARRSAPACRRCSAGSRRPCRWWARTSPTPTSR